MLFSLKPQRFVQSFFDMQAPRQPHIHVSSFFVISLCFFGDAAFSEHFCTVHCRFLFEWRVRTYVFSFRMVFFYLVTTSWIFLIFFTSTYLCENSTNQSINTYALQVSRSPRWFSWQPRNLLTSGREFESRCRHTNWDFSSHKKKCPTSAE